MSIFFGLKADTDDFGGYDFSRDLSAYVKMHNLLNKHGLQPVHYTMGHLALVSRQGKILLDRVSQEIEANAAASRPPDLILGNFRLKESTKTIDTAQFHILPLQIKKPGKKMEYWSLIDKRVLLAPACPQSISLLSDPEIRKSRLLGFLDRDRIVQGKKIQDFIVHRYHELSDMAPDVILVASPEQHQDDIVRRIVSHTDQNMQIAVLNPIQWDADQDEKKQE
jgi:hypothetical protein